VLTNKTIKAEKPQPKPHRLKDQGGLYLLCTPNGTKLWRLKYRIRREGKRVDKLLALGAYPAIGLAEARRLQTEAKALVRAGRDPLTERMTRRVKAERGLVETVEALAREWYGKQAPRWSSGYAAGVLDRLKRLVFPLLGQLHINDVTPPLMYACLERLEARGANNTAHVVRQHMDKVFGYAISRGIANANPAAQVKEALTPAIKRNQPAIVEIGELRRLMRRIEDSPSHPPIKLAFRLLALSACRPSEVCGAAWQEFEQLDGPAPIWRIPANRMKKRREHVVPLPPQAVALVETIRPLTGHSRFLFPNMRSLDLPMRRSSFMELLYRCDYRGQHSGHGFRASFSSIMKERHPRDWASIEAALAHAGDEYTRTTFLERRRELMAEWADLLLEDAPPPETLLYGPRR
jgi:integrase